MVSFSMRNPHSSFAFTDLIPPPNSPLCCIATKSHGSCHEVRDPYWRGKIMPAKNINPAPSGGSSARAWNGSRQASRAKPKRVSLALQGGGAYGAFTWGVLDRLLEEEISFDAVSGASIGAINAVLLASGLAKDGPDGARATLDAFWTKLSRMGILTRLLPPEMRQAASAFGVGSPYQFNPLDLNPVRTVHDSF